MKALCYIAFFVLFAPVVMRAETGSESNREEGFTFEGEIGASLMGFQDMLGKHYGPRGTIHVSARVGPQNDRWLVGSSRSTTPLYKTTSLGPYFYNGGLNTARGSVSSNLEQLRIDFRYNLNRYKRFRPFLEYGVGSMWTRTRIEIQNPEIGDHDDRLVDIYDLHSDRTFNQFVGLGKRVYLFDVSDERQRGSWASGRYTYLDIRIGLNIGGHLSYVNGAPGWSDSTGFDNTGHRLHDRPIFNSGTSGIVIGISYGVSLNQQASGTP